MGKHVSRERVEESLLERTIEELSALISAKVFGDQFVVDGIGDADLFVAALHPRDHLADLVLRDLTYLGGGERRKVDNLVEGIEEVGKEPELYDHCFVAWKGVVANLLISETKITFDFSPLS